MAFVQDEDEKKKEQEGSQPQLVTGPSSVTPQQGQSAAPTIGSQPVKQQPSQRRAGSGRFQNLSRFIQANEGAGQRIGQQLGGNIQQRSQKLGQLIGQQGQQVQQQAGQEMQRLNQATPFIQQAVANPLQTIQDVASSERFANLRQNVLNLPEIAAQGDIQGQLQNLATTAQQTGSEAGRLGLLRQAFNLPGYSRGASRLDQLLLQSDPTALQQLGQTGREQAGLQQESFGDIQAQQAQLASDIQELGQQRATEAMKAATGAKTGRLKTLEERAKQTQSDFTGRREDIATKLRRGDALTNEDFNFMGIPEESRGELNEMIQMRGDKREMEDVVLIDSSGNRRTLSGQEARDLGIEGIDQKIDSGEAVEKIKYRQLPKFDFSEYLAQVDPSQFGVQQVASEEELAKLNALQQLMGEQDAYDTRLAGTTPEDIGFNYQSALGRGRSALGPQYVPGSYQTQSPYVEESSSSNFINDLLSVGGVMLDPTGGIIQKVVEPVTSIFCFRPNTLVTMEDGSKKAIKDITVRDRVALGGMVHGIGEALNDAIYIRNGVEVSAGHAFFNGSSWERVGKDNAEYIGNGELQSVYMIWTENHLLEINGSIWADNAEVDDYSGLTEEELLDILNSDTNRNKELSQLLNEEEAA